MNSRYLLSTHDFQSILGSLAPLFAPEKPCYDCIQMWQEEGKTLFVQRDGMHGGMHETPPNLFSICRRVQMVPCPQTQSGF